MDGAQGRAGGLKTSTWRYKAVLLNEIHSFCVTDTDKLHGPHSL